MSDKLPETGWDAAAQHYVDQTGADLSEARDKVIRYFLENGDTRPYADWVLRGHMPSATVLRVLALLMVDGAPDNIAKALPYKIVSKRRDGKAGARRNPENVIRDTLFSENVAKLVDAGWKYDAAIAEVADMSGKKSMTQTVRDAYDVRHPRLVR